MASAQPPAVTEHQVGAPVRLGADEIHLWFAFRNQFNEAGLFAVYRKLLAPAERAQEERYRFEEDRIQYVITRALVRTVLSRYLCLAPRELAFRTNAYGRPDVDNPVARREGLSFSVSRSDGIVVLGVTQGRTLGIDVEKILTRSALSADAVSRFFAPDEVAALAGIADSEKNTRILEYWTLKEAYAKARGVGLSLPLDKFAFDYPQDGVVRMTLSPDLADDSAHWAVWQLQASSRYLLAVCAERLGSSVLVSRETVPLVTERTYTPTLLRTSA